MTVSTPFITVAGISCDIRPISARGVLKGAALTTSLALNLKKRYGEGDYLPLSEGACICMLCLFRDGSPRFATPQQVLRAMSVEEIHAVRSAYEAMMAGVGGKDDELL